MSLPCNKKSENIKIKNKKAKPLGLKAVSCEAGSFPNDFLS